MKTQKPCIRWRTGPTLDEFIEHLWAGKLTHSPPIVRIRLRPTDANEWHIWVLDASCNVIGIRAKTAAGPALPMRYCYSQVVGTQCPTDFLD